MRRARRRLRRSRRVRSDRGCKRGRQRHRHRPLWRRRRERQERRRRVCGRRHAISKDRRLRRLARSDVRIPVHGSRRRRRARDVARILRPQRRDDRMARSARRRVRFHRPAVQDLVSRRRLLSLFLRQRDRQGIRRQISARPTRPSRQRRGPVRRDALSRVAQECANLRRACDDPILRAPPRSR